jgi:hypothetical protein
LQNSDPKRHWHFGLDENAYTDFLHQQEIEIIQLQEVHKCGNIQTSHEYVHQRHNIINQYHITVWAGNGTEMPRRLESTCMYLCILAVWLIQ